MKAARLAPPLLALLPVGCDAGPIAPELAKPTPVFAAEIFFAGRTRGDGTLTIVMRSPQTIRVEGAGRVEADGSLVLDQIVKRGDKPAEKRQWRFRQAGPGRYTGTLSDAGGPVQGQVRGNTLHLSYPMKNGMHAQQWLYLQPDGRSALNRMAISKFGMVVARVDETIRKVD